MNAVECIHVDDQPAGVLRRVTVRAAEAARDDAASQMRWLGIVLFRNLGDRVGDHFHVGGVDSTCAVVAAVRPPQPVRVRAWVWRAGCGVSSAVVDIKVEVTWE